jgi:uncharacterized membrane protein
MYGITKEHIYLLFALALAILIWYIVLILSGSLLYSVLTGFSVLLFLIGARFYVAETNEERVLGSFTMAAGIGIYVAMMYGSSAGIIAALSLLACCLALIYFLSEE